MSSVGIVVQARMGSNRLPGKVLRPVGQLPLLGHITGRLAQLSQCWPVIVATSSDARDDAIVDWCQQADVATFRGSEHDVLDRYLQCARICGFEHIVRLTADNPFTDVPELERLVQLHFHGGFDYTHSFGFLPVGVGAEVITWPALLRSHVEGLLSHHREHVNEYIQENPGLFKIGVLNVPPDKWAPHLRLTIDTEEDWRRADALVSETHGPWLTTQEAIRLCSSSA
jgi:spore coat polysaccharide biosynthesis protein SpsF